MSSKSRVAESLAISNEILSDLELGTLSLSNCFMKACRLARLLSDHEYLTVFQYEVGGYPSGPDGIPQHSWQACLVAGRVSLQKNDDGTGDKKTAYTSSIEELEGEVQTIIMRLDFLRPQPVSISSANPNQYVMAPTKNIGFEGNLAKALRETRSKIASRKAFLYNYVLEKNYELKFSASAAGIFDTYIDYSSGEIIKTVPDEIKKLDSIEDNLRSDNHEDWANAVHSCRRLLEALAEVVFPAQSEPRVTASGKRVKLGKDNYINRLVCYCEDNSESGVFRSIFGSEIRFVGERLDAAFNASQKGSHAVVGKEEARRIVIHVYLLVTDILSLKSQTENLAVD